MFALWRGISPHYLLLGGKQDDSIGVGDCSRLLKVLREANRRNSVKMRSTWPRRSVTINAVLGYVVPLTSNVVGDLAAGLVGPSQSQAT